MGPFQSQALAEDRLAAAHGQRRWPVRSVPPARRRSLRKSAGWLLIGLGLRLAVPRHVAMAVPR